MSRLFTESVLNLCLHWLRFLVQELMIRSLRVSFLSVSLTWLILRKGLECTSNGVVLQTIEWPPSYSPGSIKLFKGSIKTISEWLTLDPSLKKASVFGCRTNQSRPVGNFGNGCRKIFLVRSSLSRTVLLFSVCPECVVVVEVWVLFTHRKDVSPEWIRR